MAVATAGSDPPTAVAGPVAGATASRANGMWIRSPVVETSLLDGPPDEREKSTQPASGGSASWVAVVFWLMDLRRAASPSPDPFGRVMVQPGFGAICSCAAAVTGLTASHEPTRPPPTPAAK